MDACLDLPRSANLLVSIIIHAGSILGNNRDNSSR